MGVRAHVHTRKMDFGLTSTRAIAYTWATHHTHHTHHTPQKNNELACDGWAMRVATATTDQSQVSLQTAFASRRMADRAESGAA
jgi:hypothetical protein